MLDAKQIAEIVRQRDHDDEVTPSMLHYYVQAGIVPPAVGRGRNAYTPEHLARFRHARQLKRQGLSLADIRDVVTRTPAPGLPADPTGQPAVPRAAPSRRRLLLARRAEAPAPMPRSATRRTVRFKGGFSLQVPAGTSDESLARLYAAVEAVIEKEAKSREGR